MCKEFNNYVVDAFFLNKSFADTYADNLRYTARSINIVLPKPRKL